MTKCWTSGNVPYHGDTLACTKAFLRSDGSLLAWKNLKMEGPREDSLLVYCKEASRYKNILQCGLLVPLVGLCCAVY